MNPDTGVMMIFEPMGFNYGLVAAVIGFNRKAVLVEEVIRWFFGVPALSYFDDFYGGGDVMDRGREGDEWRKCEKCREGDPKKMCEKQCLYFRW